ncbi:unnamed protein product [Prunus armeniaca]
MKVVMDKDLGKQVFAYFLNAFPNSDQYILGPFFCTYPEEVEKLWVTQPRNDPTYFSDLTWVIVWESSKPFKGWPMGTPIKMDPTTTKEALSKKASSVPENPTTQALRKLLSLQLISRHHDAMLLVFIHQLHKASLPDDDTQLARLGRYHQPLPRDDFSTANHPDTKVGLDFHKSNKTFGSWVKTYLGHGGESTDPLPPMAYPTLSIWLFL